MAPILAVVMILAFIVGYILGDAFTPAAVYWARNIFGVSFVMCIFWLLLDELQAHDAISLGAVTAMMVACWLLTMTKFSGYVPTWLANGWVELVVGVVFAALAALCLLPVRKRSDAG